MSGRRKDEKNADVHVAIRQAIEDNRYRHTLHALQRHNERGIRLTDALHVLRTGYREPSKDSFDEAFGAWKYAVRGKSLQDEDLRMIVAFADDLLVIITVMYVGEI